MQQREITIEDPVGIHARPAAEVVRAAGRHQAKVQIANGAKVADARSIVQLLGLGVRMGTVVMVTADGPDEQEALEAVLAVLAKGAAQ